MTRKDFQTIDLDALEGVTGGRRTATSSTSGDDRILDAIDSLKDAITDLGKQQQQKQSGSGMEQLLPMLMMQLLNGGRGGGGGGGPGWGGGNGCGGGRY